MFEEPFGSLVLASSSVGVGPSMSAAPVQGRSVAEMVASAWGQGWPYGLAVVGGLLVLAGLWTVWGRRVLREEERSRALGVKTEGEQDSAAMLAGPAPKWIVGRWIRAAYAWRARVAETNRLATGIALLIVGYHFVAWSGVAGQGKLLSVPPDRWWMLVLPAVLGVAVLGWIEGRRESSEER